MNLHCKHFCEFWKRTSRLLAFNDIQSDYYQLPSEDKEKIRIAEEKIREELKDKTIEVNQDNSQSDSQSEIKEEKMMITMIIKLKRKIKN